jgi:hypothetical protein
MKRPDTLPGLSNDFDANAYQLSGTVRVKGQT